MATVSDPRFEINDPRFDSESAPPTGPPDRRSPWRTCLIGCLAAVAIILLLVVVMGIWVWRNWRDLAATTATEGMNQMIDASDLPPQEKQELKAEVRRVAEAFREKRVSNEQMMTIVEEVFRSPLLTMFVVSAVEKKYLERSGLSQDEKTEGRRTLRRFVRGSVDGKIDDQAVDSVMTHVAEEQRDGSWQMKEQVSDAELRAALAAAKQAADDAGIPEQPEEVDASAEFKRIVDEVMQKRELQMDKDAAEDAEIAE